ncbi:MAG TPA: FtsW/RodA/SpoVE family cell cycle protein [Anaerolineales bacterium]|nr:FtsW/RodA/SpoVE family cell cycle protein [Anaerolineales bacterium]
MANQSIPLVDRRQRRLLIAVAVFLFLYSAILTLSPAVREQTWNVPYRWSHWIGLAIWAACCIVADRFAGRQLPRRDPLLLPLGALLSGWGLLTIWRLDSAFGIRQSIWLMVSTAILVAIFQLPADLSLLRRYKYILLTSGIVLTGLTIFLGTNPEGYGPRLWLGCCGVYLQPSEPLKLLLVIYLSAYLGNRWMTRVRFFRWLFPTLFVTGLALLLLLFQRDLGTASIFLLVYAVVLYAATAERRVLLATALMLALAGVIGYFFIPLVHERISAWLDPWADPSGHGYQIVQSLLAIANGGMIGRGPGLGSPTLVPVAQSDFIFTSVAEETGLLGTTALIISFGLLLGRGLRAALRAPDRFRRTLAAGLSAYLGIQTLLIINGNLRLLPLTGVTLPFVSYGGSSLLTAFVALGLLLIISNQAENNPAALPAPRPYYFVIGLLGLGLIATMLADSWWAVLRGPDLLARTDNPRLAISDRYVARGDILDRNNQPIDVTLGQSGTYHRVYLYPDLSPLTGYIHPTYGEAGLEGSLDNYLRGLQGNPASLIWWDHLLYGTPPPGLDVRLSLDLELQKHADQLLGDQRGAVVLMNAQSGEILVMASHPTYDPNKLDEIGASLAQDQSAPLINRATQGTYPAGSALNLFLDQIDSTGRISDDQEISLFESLGFYSAPQIRGPVAAAAGRGQINDLRISPLQMSIAAGTLSNHGVRIAPRIVMAVRTPQQGWVVLPALDQGAEVFKTQAADDLADRLARGRGPYWEWSGTGQAGSEFSTWYLGGTVPNWKGIPLAVVVLLEGNDPPGARSVGTQLLQIATSP